ncbi:MAG: autotransporter outer membrane beta-barrel domain-containing protein [Endomicrobium sp.]|nr:autotransporter outer membrane beta-barrel domain-containing protein [Endomicrobium sp.]
MKNLREYKNKAGNLPLRKHSARLNFKLCLYFALVFFMFFLSSPLNQVFAQQTITIKKIVRGNVYGNGDISKDGCLDNKSKLKHFSGNRVNIDSGGKVTGQVVGGYSNLDRIGIGSSDNIVSINGGIVKGSILGGAAYYKEAAGNTVAIFDGDIASRRTDYTIAGAGGIFGGVVAFDGTATGNSVEIFGGVIRSNFVYGGFVGRDGDVSSNIVTINGGKLYSISSEDNGLIIGGCANLGDAIDNSVTVNNGAVHMNVCGGIVKGTGNATGNSVTINGGEIESKIVCGGASNRGNAINNRVTIAKSQGIKIDLLCGGLTPNGDAVSGNTLCIKTSHLEVEGVSNFQNYYFCLPADIQSEGDAVLLSKKGGKSFGDDKARPINLANTNINACIACGRSLQVGEHFPLIETPQGFQGFNKNKKKPLKLTLKQGFALRYDCKLSELPRKPTTLSTEPTIFLDLSVAGNAKFNREVKLFSESRAASVAFLNQGSDVISDKGLSEAVTSVSPNSIKSVSCFTAASGAKLKYDTDSHVNVNGISTLTGLAKGIDTKFGQLTTGAFFEYGSSNYTNSFSEFSSVEGGGNAEYKGGGALGYFDFRNNFYGEVSGRIGSITTAFYSLDITCEPDVFAKYNYDTQYIGAHAGCGYLWDINNKLGLNLYGKYFFTHQNGKDVVLPTSEVVKFADTDSERIRVGAKFSNNVNKDVSLYFGVAYERELDGIVNATMLDRNIPAPSLGGGTVAGEIGVKGSVGVCCINLSAQGYTGSREGINGMLRFSFAFFNFANRCLGYSLEKFYDKENTGRFNQTFNMSKKESFNKCLDVIKELKAKVTHKSFRKGYIVAFDLSKSFKDLCLDSTEACIFITETESGNANVEVVSTNSFLAQDVSVEFFKMLGAR